VSAPRFEEVELGDELPELHPDVSMENVRRFCRAAHMEFERFTDHEGARRQGLPGAIVPGVMSQGALAALVHRWAPGATLRKVDTVFRAPVRVDSAPVCRGVVTDTDDETRTVEIDLTIVNEAGETPVVGTAVVALA
jgi:acyl dehydratase